MATCKWCGRSGLFLSVSDSGLCGNCNPMVTMDVDQRSRVIDDSTRRIESSTKLDAQIAQCDLLLENADNLLRYEERGIPIFDPPPSELIREYEARHDQLITEGMQQEFEDAIGRAKVAANPKARSVPLSKFLLRVREYKDATYAPNLLDDLEKQAADLLHAAQLNAYLEAAQKAEFKGQLKKALDQYYEALYFLRHDDVDDTLQAQHITAVEAKIAELGGNVAEA